MVTPMLLTVVGVAVVDRVMPGGRRGRTELIAAAVEIFARPGARHPAADADPADSSEAVES
jgi:hypothetical protein